jgi:hypothetical protein
MASSSWVTCSSDRRVGVNQRQRHYISTNNSVTQHNLKLLWVKHREIGPWTLVLCSRLKWESHKQASRERTVQKAKDYIRLDDILITKFSRPCPWCWPEIFIYQSPVRDSSELSPSSQPRHSCARLYHARASRISWNSIVAWILCIRK